MHKTPIECQKEMNGLFKILLDESNFNEKLNKTTDALVSAFGVELCCIWLINPCDRKKNGCPHIQLNEPATCSWDKCLHLASISGNSSFTTIHTKQHKRVPFGCYEIGGLAVGEDNKFLLNTIPAKLTLYSKSETIYSKPVSFAGYQIRPQDGDTIGVMMLLSKNAISTQHDIMLECLAKITGQVIMTNRSEKTLIAERRRQFEILYKLPLLFYIVDQNYYIRFANRIFNERYGKHSEGKKCYSQIAGLLKPCKACTVQHVFKTSRHVDPSNVSICKKDYLVYSAPFPNANNDSLVSVIHIDINEPIRIAREEYQRKKLEEYQTKYSLTARECCILGYILSGKSDKEIANMLFISANTVKRHTQSIYQKIEVHSRIKLISLFKWCLLLSIQFIFSLFPVY